MTKTYTLYIEGKNEPEIYNTYKSRYAMIKDVAFTMADGADWKGLGDISHIVKTNVDEQKSQFIVWDDGSDNVCNFAKWADITKEEFLCEWEQDEEMEKEHNYLYNTMIHGEI